MPNFTNKSRFSYNTLDPSPHGSEIKIQPPPDSTVYDNPVQSPVQIEEYSELYDDYLDSPDENSIATMNSNAAIYEQSVDPSYDNFEQPPNQLNRLNNNYNSLVSDDSLDSSFNNDSVSPFRTPKSFNNSKFENNSTPIVKYNVTPKIPPIPNAAPIMKSQSQNNSDYSLNSSTNNNDNNNADSSFKISKIPIPQYTAAELGLQEDEDDDDEEYYDGEDSNFVDENNEAYNDNIENDDYDDDLNEEEVEKLRLIEKKKNQQIYQSYNLNIVNNNDATIITKENNDVKIIKKGIKDFKIGKELGEGSYSTVVLAIDVTNNKKYAIKILNKRHIIKEKKVKYVNIEKNALNRLGKRNGIIGLHFTFQDSASLYFVLDFAENGELLTLIKKFGTMNEATTKHYSIQLIDAINYMHDNGIVHRDLKPENILIDKSLKLQITDFGTAKLLDKDEKTGKYPSDIRANSFVGTAEYVSPELLNDKYCGKAADIWALGCIIYQMIAGKPPFKATNEYLTFQKIQKLQYAFTAGFPIIIRDLIKRMLILKPSERLTIKDIKHHLWFNKFNWNDQNLIWETKPPIEAGPYKISAKAMKPIPELDLQYPNGSSTSLKNLKAKKMTQHHRQYNNNHNNKSASPQPQSSSLTNQQRYKTTANPANAATVALYGKNNDNNSNVTTTVNGIINNTNGDKNSAKNSITNKPNKSKKIITSNSSPVSYSNGKISSSEIQQLTADRIIKSRQTSSSSSATPNLSFSKNNNVDVIPGTNIPRPVLNTKIPVSRSNTGIKPKSRNNSSLNKNITKKNEIPQMSTLDLKFVQYLKNHDERILKVGLVDALHEKSSLFEKKYKGMLIESPLGYKNKDHIINHDQLFSMNDDESILVLDDSINVPKHNSITNEINEKSFNEVEEEGEEIDDSSVGKFRKFFTVKVPSPVVENNFVTRTMVITTFGRALLLHENYGVDNKSKYEVTTEIDLTNFNVHFVEVIGSNDKKIKMNKGLFAIMSGLITICLEADKGEVSQWTQALANSRLIEKERRLKEYLNSSNNNDLIIGEETALSAAALAATKNPEGLSTSSTIHKINGSNKLFPTTLRNPEDNINGEKASKSTANRKVSNSSNNKNVRKQSVNKEKKTIGKGPMISAAINKAVSMASPNAAVGGKKNDKQPITSSNSKFLARSRLK